MSSHADIDSVLTEQRVFEPSEDFRSKAHINSKAEYDRLYKEAAEHPAEFWAKIASELHWFKPWDRVLEWNLPFAQWFIGAELNLSYN
jgi:acetyl-CoA synthetase